MATAERQEFEWTRSLVEAECHMKPDRMSWLGSTYKNQGQGVDSMYQAWSTS